MDRLLWWEGYVQTDVYGLQFFLVLYLIQCIFIGSVAGSLSHCIRLISNYMTEMYIKRNIVASRSIIHDTWLAGWWKKASYSGGW